MKSCYGQLCLLSFQVWQSTQSVNLLDQKSESKIKIFNLKFNKQFHKNNDRKLSGKFEISNWKWEIKKKNYITKISENFAFWFEGRRILEGQNINVSISLPQIYTVYRKYLAFIFKKIQTK